MFHWRQIDCAPIALFRGSIGIRDANHFGNADDRFVGNTVIEENLIADTHAAEIISRLEIADAGPTSFLFFDQIAPGIGFRFGFHEPVVFHERRKSFPAAIIDRVYSYGLGG